MKPPNILYLHSHDTGRLVQPYGHDVPTPRIQRLAEEGLLFRRAFSAAPTCSPSRAALLTGQVPHSCGQLGLVNRGFQLQYRDRHLAHTLREAGYLTALVGTHHVVRDPVTCGYEVHLTTPDHQAANVAPAAANFLTNLENERPFFLSVGFFETHRPFPDVGPAEDARYCRPPSPLPDAPETRLDMAAYRASAGRLDEAVGLVLDTLNAKGLSEDTLVICTTDHGPAFPLMKCNLTDHGIGVMLLMRGPAGFLGGQVNDAMVSQIDLYPTICDLVGIPKPDWLQGHSLLPLVKGDTEKIRDQITAEVNYHAAYQPMRAIRTDRWKLIRRYGEGEFPILPNIDDGPSKDLLLRHGFADRPQAQEAFYDLIYDPIENCNRISDEALNHEVAEMRQRLEDWMVETADPLLSGPIPLPVNAFASRPEDRSPSDIWTYTSRPTGFG